MFSRNAWEFNKTFRIIIDQEEAHPSKDNASISLRKRQFLFTFPAFQNVRINSNFRFLQKQMSAI